MTRDGIIKLAREAGFTSSNGFSMLVVRHSNGSWVDISVELERFAALVAAAERERIACEFDRRAVYADGTQSSGWYEPHEPAEIVRAMRPKANAQPQRQQKVGAARAGNPA